MSMAYAIAFWLYLALYTLLFAMGVMFLVRREFMPYHAVAVGMPWKDVPNNFRILIRALLKFMGGTAVAVSIGGFVLVLIPFKEEAAWASWATPLLGLTQCAAIANATTEVVRKTPGRPPLRLLAGATAMFVVAFVLSLL